MEVLYGLVLLLTFILGFGIGLTMPIIIKKYVKFYKENETKEVKVESEEIKDEKKNDIPYIPKDLLAEWLTGEELKPNDEQ